GYRRKRESGHELEGDFVRNLPAQPGTTTAQRLRQCCRIAMTQRCDEAGRMAQIGAHADFGNGEASTGKLRIADRAARNDIGKGAAHKLARPKLALARCVTAAMALARSSLHGAIPFTPQAGPGSARP